MLTPPSHVPPEPPLMLKFCIEICLLLPGVQLLSQSFSHSLKPRGESYYKEVGAGVETLDLKVRFLASTANYILIAWSCHVITILAVAMM